MAKPKPIDPKIAELQADIETLNLVINDPDIPDDVRDESRASVAEIEAEIENLKKPKVVKPKKDKPAKPEVKLGGKSFKEVSSSELESAFNERMNKVSELGGKSKTKSIFASTATESSTPATA